jgi:hypothetical protein
MAGNDKASDPSREPRGGLWADQPTLSVQRAFVVHFNHAGEPGHHRFSGRVEHLPSGEIADFSSLKGLLAFFVDVIDAGASSHGPRQDQRAPVAPTSSKVKGEKR